MASYGVLAADGSTEDYFGSPLILPKTSTAQEIKDAQNESNSNDLANMEAKRVSEGTAGTTQNVPNSSKATRRAVAGGSAKTYKNTQNRTGYVPNPNDETSLKAADYYRTGLYTDVTKIIAGKEETIKEWNPLPELVTATSDEYSGVLASIKLIDPKKIKSNDNGSQDRAQLIPEYSKFFLEGVQEAHQEKVQIVETFNDFYAFFYGEKPPIYTFSGHLLNLKNYNWMNEFMYYYQNFWRGTKAVELGARIFLTYNYQQIQGYILSINTNIDALTDKAVPFNMQVLVTKRLIFNGQKADGVIRDNLLPNNNPLIDTQASNFATALVKKSLAGERPASGLDIISDSNADRGITTLKNSIPSAAKDEFAGGNKATKKFFQGSPVDLLKQNIPGGKTGNLRGAAMKAGLA